MSIFITYILHAYEFEHSIHIDISQRAFIIHTNGHIKLGPHRNSNRPTNTCLRPVSPKILYNINVGLTSS